MTVPDLERLRSIPKVELHVHLEGSIGPALLLDLASRNGLDLKARSIAELDKRFDFQSFHDFLMLFGDLTYALCKPEDFTEAVLSYAASASADGVIYCEMTVTLDTHVKYKSLDPLEIMKALWIGAQEAERRYGVMVRFVIDYVRSFPAQGFRETIEHCLIGRKYGVVALGFGGPEEGFPPSRFDTELRYARSLGIPFVPHAGEAADARSIWDALGYSPRRIGHGIAAAEDPELLAIMRDDRVMIEVCLSSNVALSHVANLESHPARGFFEHGIPISINTDDPPMFRTSVLREYELAMSLGFSLEELMQLNRQAIEFALASDRDRTRIRHRFDTFSSKRSIGF